MDTFELRERLNGHYKIVEQRRAKRLAGQTKGLTWDEVKQKLIQKYRFLK